MINGDIALGLLAFGATLFLFGAPVKLKLPHLPLFLLPAAGMTIFGGLIVPIFYLIGWYDYVWYAVYALGISGGLAALWFLRKKIKFTKPNLEHIALALVLIVLAVGFVVQASPFPVIGGIDSALHSTFLTDIVLGNGYDISYPLGMHTLILGINRITQLSTAVLFQSLAIFFVLYTIALVYAIVKKISGSALAGFFAILAGLIDVSINNNFLNGSVTHLLAAVLLLTGIGLSLWRPAGKNIYEFVFLMFFYASLFYFHFITLVLLMPILWLLQLQRAESPTKEHIFAFLAGLVLSLRVIISFLHLPGFIWQISTIVVAFIGIELLVLHYHKQLKKIILYRWTQVGLALAGLGVFWYFFSASDSLPQWYGIFVFYLATAGTAIALVRNMSAWYPFITYWGILILGYYAITKLPLPHGNVEVVTDLLYYYGFTVPLIILGGAGIWGLHGLVKNRWARTATIAIACAFIAIIVSARFFDEKLLPNDTNTVSRYSVNNGFGIFYGKDDVRVAEWAKANLPADAGIVNPGGLYNTWASLSQRRIMYHAYGDIHSFEADKAHAAVLAVLTNETSECPTPLLNAEYRYLMIPTQFSVYFRNPCATLLYQSGTARLYRIGKTAGDTVASRGIMFSDVHRYKNDIDVTGSYQIICNHCGNRFYAQFQEVDKSMLVPEKGSLIITLPAPTENRFINLVVVGDNAALRAEMLPATAREITADVTGSPLVPQGEYILKDFVQTAGQTIRVRLSNTTRDYTIISGIALDSWQN